jgi:hypothetical protein
MDYGDRGRPDARSAHRHRSERFWDVYQQKELPKVYDYVMRTTGNRHRHKQPYHRDFDIEVWMSERLPDRRGRGAGPSLDAYEDLLLTPSTSSSRSAAA